MQAKEWLCLNCQTQRALNAPGLTAPLKTCNEVNKFSPFDVHPKITPPNEVECLKKELLKSDAPLKMVTPVADTVQKKESFAPGSLQKTKPTALTQTTKVAEGPQSDPQTSPTPSQKTPVDIRGVSGSQKPTDKESQPEQKQSRIPEDTQQESGKLFGLSSAKTGPDSSKTTESRTGKMFVFGSSIFSSASTMLSSAVQEESRTTPPGSRKMSAPPQVSPNLSAIRKVSTNSTPPVSPKMSPSREPKTQKPEQKKKPAEPNQSKEENAPSQPPKMATISHDTGEVCCPLCKVRLNIVSKDPLNYNTCTECKITVCTQCGFSPVPIGKVS